jgi:hypothetical protein
MHGRSCGSLLAVWLLTLCSPPAMWGQTSASFAKPGLDPPVLDQLVPVHPQSPTGPGATTFRPNPPGQVSRMGSGKSFPSGGAPTFPELARTAGTIFAGTVTRIEPGPATGGSAVPTVAITFRVEHPLRAAAAGGSLTILEWLGLWSSGQRYAVGEHVLLFLYPPSKLGLTSAVGGGLGQFHLDSAGGILPSEQQFAAFRADPLFAGRSRIPFNDFSRMLHLSIGEPGLE